MRLRGPFRAQCKSARPDEPATECCLGRARKVRSLSAAGLPVRQLPPIPAGRPTPRATGGDWLQQPSDGTEESELTRPFIDPIPPAADAVFEDEWEFLEGEERWVDGPFGLGLEVEDN